MIKLAYDAKQASGTPDPWPVYDRIPLGKLATGEEWGDRSVQLILAQAKTNRLYFRKNIAQPDDDNQGVIWDRSLPEFPALPRRRPDVDAAL